MSRVRDSPGELSYKMCDNPIGNKAKVAKSMSATGALGSPLCKYLVEKQRATEGPICYCAARIRLLFLTDGRGGELGTAFRSCVCVAGFQVLEPLRLPPSQGLN